MADNVVMADRVVARRPMHMPEGTYDPKAVVVIDRGDPTKPLEKLALGELMPRTEGSAVLAALGTTREDNGEFSVDSITVLTGDCIHTELGKVYLDKGYYHVSATFVVWMDRDMPPVDGIIVPHIGAAIGSGNTYLTEVGASFDLSNSSSTDTLSISFDTDISSDGTELRLVLGGMPSVSADEAGLAKVTLEQLSVHKITAVTSGGSGGGSGGGDVVIFNVNDYAEVTTSDALWRDIMDAMLDDKAVCLISPIEDGINAVGWLDRNYDIPPGLTKEQLIETLASGDSEMASLDFNLQCSLHGGAMTMREALAVTPTGLDFNYVAFIVTGYGIILEGSSNGVGSESVLPLSNGRIDRSRIGECFSDLVACGVPALYIGYDATHSCLFSLFRIDAMSYDMLIQEPYTKGFWLRASGIASWEGNDPQNGDTFPCMYRVTFQYAPPDSEVLNSGGWTMTNEEMYPMAIDSRYVPSAMEP